jgi:uncharacterized protein (TIGR02996 family)
VASLHNHRLEKAITARIDDDAPRLVYADWLAERGDPLGELITVQHTLAANPKDKKLTARAAKLVAGFALPGDLELRWRAGFVDEACVHNNDCMARTIDAPALLGALLASPVGIALRSLKLGVLEADGHAGHVPRVIPQTLAVVASRAQHLRSLEIGWHVDDYEDVDRVHGMAVHEYDVGKLGGLSEWFPSLERLDVHGVYFELGALDLPKLRALILRPWVGSANLRRVTAARWPRLEELELWLAKVKPIDLAPILSGTHFPKLKALGLVNAPLTDEICARIARAPIVKQLQRLDLSRGTMTTAGARALAAGVKALAHLDIDLDQNYLTADDLGLLREAGLRVQGGERDPSDDDDGERRPLIA